MSLDMGLHLLVLRCLSPFTVILGAVLFSQIPACFIDPSKRTVLRAHQRAVSQCLTLLILSTYIVEAFLFLAGLICLRDWTAVEIFLDGEDGMGRVVYTLLCFFIWLFTYHLLCDPFTEPLFRFACVSTWILATSMDTTISLLSAQSRSRSFDYCQVIVQISRFVCLTIICVYNFPPIWNKPRRGLNRQPPLDTVLSARTGNDKYHDELPGADTPVEDGIKNENLGKHSQEQLHRVHQLGGCPNENPRLQRYVEYMFLLNVAILLCPRLLGDLVDMINHMREDTGQLNIGCLIKVVKILNDTILKQATRSLSLRVCRSYKELGLSLYFHDNEQAGKFQAAIEEDLKTSANLDQLFRTILPLSLEVCIASAYLAYLFDVYLGLILLSTYIFYGVFTCSMTPLIAKERRKDQATHRIQRTFYQSIANWMSCFYFNRRDYQRHRVKESTQQELREVQRSYQIGQLMQALQSLAVLLSYGALLFRVAYLFKTDDRPVAKFLSPLWFHIALTAPLHKLEQVHNLLIELCVDTERLLESITVTDAEDAKDLVFKGGKVEFRNIGFSYDGLNPVIKDLSFEVKAGSTVAFVGQSESGKTTTCDKLLLRGYDVTDGSIFVDGQDIRTVTQKSLRETIGIVRQKQSIYNDTVMEVVRYTRLDATDEEVVQACKDAAIHEGILKLPKGYDSKIGEHGVKLPGAGQRLIAIAQLFLRDPKIFVLDEATASVDNIIESEIQDSFLRFCRGRTTIVVAPCISTVRHADQIFVLDKGKIVECGTHVELLKLRGRYSLLWNKKQTLDTLKKLEHDLQQFNSDKEHPHDDTDSYESDSSSIVEIVQVDGASDSKQAENPHSARAGMRKKLNSFKESCGYTKKRDDEYEDYDESDETNADASPIRLVSPRATGATVSRSASTSKRPKNRPISAPVVPTQSNTGTPSHSRNDSTPNAGMFLSPPRPIPVGELEKRALATASPGKEAALGSHPPAANVQDAEEPDVFGTPRTSIGS